MELSSSFRLKAEPHDDPERKEYLIATNDYLFTIQIIITTGQSALLPACGDGRETEISAFFAFAH